MGVLRWRPGGQGQPGSVRAGRDVTFAKDGAITALGSVIFVSLFFTLQQDAIAGCDHLGVHHARLRAAETGIAPLDKFYRYEFNLVRGDIQPCGQVGLRPGHRFCSLGGD